MQHLIYWTLLLILTLLVHHIKISEACSCNMQHPQTHFCRSDFVAVIRVENLTVINDIDASYKVKIQKIFKASQKSEHILKQRMLLWTSAIDATCGRLNMEPGETWVVGGQMNGPKPTISLCNLAMRWSEVTRRQRKGFRQLYHNGCVCQISYIPWWNKGAILNSVGHKRCLWESAPGPSDCQKKYGICTLRTGGCSWLPSATYDECIMRHRRDRKQQRS